MRVEHHHDTITILDAVGRTVAILPAQWDRARAEWLARGILDLCEKWGSYEALKGKARQSQVERIA